MNEMGSRVPGFQGSSEDLKLKPMNPCLTAGRLESSNPFKNGSSQQDG